MSLLPVYEFGDERLNRWFDRSPEFDPKLTAQVVEILGNVFDRGEAAVLEQSRRYDSAGLDSIWVSPEDLANAVVSEEDMEALRLAADRIQDFHEVQLSTLVDGWEELPLGWGWRMDAIEEGEDTGFEGQRLLPLESVGVYVPGGKGTYPSSVLMNAIPARVAGVERIVVCTPVREDGTVDPAVLVACQLAGVSQVVKAGGAAAVGLLAFGCSGFARVDKVVGPGNKFVNEAKRQLWGSVGLDSYAGPSEVAVYADGSCSARVSAVDLLTQVEHAEDNVGVLICRGQRVADAVIAECEGQLIGSAREDVMRSALRNHGVCVVVKDDEEAGRVINRFAPEHLSLHCENAGYLAQQVRNCGCVLIGPDTPQAAGDFVSGPSHTLPTSGAARFSSPVNVLDFLKVQSVSSLTRSDLVELSPVVERFGAMEGFPVHGQGGAVRLNED